ncbi:branched-chain amino acid ABC transporter permease [Salinirussus salinus]|uniref:branched-chain amino acid ABC transporter permease n=1 Tax=Salinirussus salinus TaxID=1198300 RepID=UPI00135A5FB8|nr:branched-chain amino acid ABC transporter permease [Salinirussus salinus]
MSAATTSRLTSAFSFTRAVVWATLIFLAAIPLLFMNGLATGYTLHIFILVLVYSLLATSLNLLVGYTGPESFAHGALFGIGGYATGILALEFGVPVFAGILLGALAAVAAAFFISLPSLRLKGIYFAILTIAFQVIYQDSLLIFSDITGGINGLAGVPSIPGVFGLDSAVVDYYVVMIACVGSIYLLYRIINSGLGDTFKMIKQDEEVAKHLGYNTTRYKILSFVISAFFAGLAGGLFAQHNAFVGLTLSNLFISFQIFVFVIVGGAGYFWGPIVAAVFITYLEELLSLASVYSRVLTALMLLIVIVSIPNGIASISWREHIHSAGHRVGLLSKANRDDPNA